MGLGLGLVRQRALCRAKVKPVERCLVLGMEKEGMKWLKFARTAHRCYKVCCFARSSVGSRLLIALNVVLLVWLVVISNIRSSTLSS